MIYYKLKNGETIELKIENKEDKNFNRTTIIQALLFNRALTIEYKFYDYQIIDLNKIFEEIEQQYEDLEIKSINFEYSCYAD